MSRTRYTDEDKARLLGEFEACGGSAAAFCRERGISYQTFMAWSRKLHNARLAHRKAGSAVEFVELALEPPGGSRMESAPRVELDFGGGFVLRIHLPIPPR